ncbi:MAG TPA: hypothetical protein DEB09_05985 [Candidatus Magasanikbacteria bacterium]|nr:hypothetical protein [Candidatus Magasanikbacteria bacterium]
MREQLSERPKSAKEKAAENEVGFDIFGGQTHLHIPKYIFTLLGENRLREIIEKVYGKDFLEREFFTLEFSEYENSFMVVLPPCPYKELTGVREILQEEIRSGLRDPSLGYNEVNDPRTNKQANEAKFLIEKEIEKMTGNPG